MLCIFDFGWVRTAIRRLAITGLATFTTGLGIAELSPSNAQAQDFYGEIVATAATDCRDWTLPADGRWMGVSSNPALYALYGDRYGGDGGTTFRLPDLRDLSAQRPHREWGQMRWCVVVEGRFPDSAEGQRSDGRVTGDLMATGGNFCPTGYQMESSESLPHQQTIIWCKATGSSDGPLEYHKSQMLLFSGDTCPAFTLAAEGQKLQIENFPGVFNSMGPIYGSVPSTIGSRFVEFLLPNMVSPAPGMKWCIVTRGIYPYY